MSHSSNLMTIDAMIRNLASLRNTMISEEITVSDYLQLFDLFREVKSLEDSVENFRLILEIEDRQQGGEFADIRVGKPSEPIEGQLGSATLLDWDFIPLDFKLPSSERKLRGLDVWLAGGVG